METAQDHHGDGALLRQMAGDHGGGATAQCAWAEFYRRHARYLLRVCHRAHHNILGDLGVSDAVQDTLIRVFHRAGTFRADDTMDADAQCRAVRAWLGAILENVIRDSFRDQPEIEFVDPIILGLNPQTESDVMPESAQLLALEEALAGLSDREQYVLRTTALWYNPGQSQQRLPNKVMEHLTTHLETTSANIRQIRARAIAKLRASLISSGAHDGNEGHE